MELFSPIENQSNQYLVSLTVWIISFFCIFEIELRSYGLQNPLLPIQLLPGIYLSDFGLLLPILYSIYKTNINIYTRKIFFYLLIIFIFGFIQLIYHSNQLSAIGKDVRLFVSVVTGYSLVIILPKRTRIVLLMLNITSLLLTIISLFSLISLYSFTNIGSVRMVSETGFNLIGIPLILFTSNVIFSILYHDKLSETISSINYLLLILLSVIVMQTRSMFFVVVIGTIPIIVTKFKEWNKRSKKRKRKYFKKIVVATILISIVFFYLIHSAAVEMFYTRLLSLGSEDDKNRFSREIEIAIVFGRMKILDLIFGMGLNPQSVLLNKDGNNYNILHVGILNIWWRFGLITFSIIIIAYIKMLLNWIKVQASRFPVWSLFKKSSRKQFSLLICVPGITTIVLISLMSGGWSNHTMISLGILIGIYNLAMEGKYIGNKLMLNQIKYTLKTM